MQTIYLDISNKGVIPKIHAKQGDVGRKFLAIITDNGTTISNFESPVFSVWYEGNSGSGNYSAIDGRPAVVFDGKNATVELATQMLTNAGDGIITLVMNDDMGYQIGIWNIEYSVEAVMGMGSQEVESYYTALSETASQAISAAERAEAAAKNFVVDDTLSKSGQAADAKAVGEKIKETEEKIEIINNRVMEDTNHPGCLYRVVGDETEWLNPPMIEGVEYRTAERYSGMPVYCVAVGGQSVEGENYLDLPKEIPAGQLVSVTGHVGDYPVPFGSGGSGIVYSNWVHHSVAFSCSAVYAGLACRFVVKYTKGEGSTEVDDEVS